MQTETNYRNDSFTYLKAKNKFLWNIVATFYQCAIFKSKLLDALSPSEKDFVEDSI